MKQRVKDMDGRTGVLVESNTVMMMMMMMMMMTATTTMTTAMIRL